jgi:acetyltransferase-like isoleucine patch superfamily enzyme
LASVTLGDGVQVGKGAFISDYDVDNNYAFYSSLTQLSIGNNVVLGADAFNGATELTAATLGSNVSIGDRAFYNCTSNKVYKRFPHFGTDKILISGLTRMHLYRYFSVKSFAG